MELNGSVLSSVISSPSIPDSHLLDHPTRARCLGSWWQGLVCRTEKKQLDKKMVQAMGECFRERHGFSDGDVFRRVWKEVGETIWTPQVPLTAGTLRQIDKAFEKHMVYHGPGVSAPSPVQSSLKTNNLVRRVIDALLHGGSLRVQDLMEARLLQAVLVRRDEGIMAQFRAELQRELDGLAEHPPRDAKEELVWRSFLGHILSLLPFAYPTEQDTVLIPYLNEDGSCRRVAYSVTVIPLTSPNIATPLMAIGLTPAADNKAVPILSFIGTTYPAGDGFAATVMSDFTPGFSVGHAAYKIGRHKIDAWMKDKKDVHVVGVSLGGALAFHALRHQHKKLSRVDVYNPPGLYRRDWKVTFDEGCPINIYCQAGDLVSKMGVFPTGSKVSLYHVVPHHGGVSEDWRSSHARAFTGCEKVTILAKDPVKVNNQLYRRFLTALHRFVGPVVGIITLVTLLVYRLFACVGSALRYLKPAKRTSPTLQN